MAALDTVNTGELKGIISATQMPNVPCNMVKIKALSTNVGSVYIGNSTVTTPKGNTNITTGIELQPGDETGWITVSNVNRLYYISATVNDEVMYLALL